MHAILKSAAAAISLALVAACATEPKAPAPTAPAQAAGTSTKPIQVDYAAVVETPGRPDEDILKDIARKPASVLALFSPGPGDIILEMEAGGGYYTELLSRAVGPTGKVYMQNPAGFDTFLGDAVAKRVDGRLANVTYLKSNFDSLAVPDASADIVTWFQGPHELWYTPEGTTGGLGNANKSFLEIARVLKPGGVFVALDHVAPAGSPSSTGGDTHRIDPAIIRYHAESAGLVFDSSSDILRNPADDGLTNIFDPAIRGKTDQAILIFRKP